MKKLLNIGFSTLILVMLIVSCNHDDDYQTIQSVDKIKIDSVKITHDTMNVLTIQSIRTYTAYSSSCEGFYGYDYVHNDSLSRTVTAYQYKTNGSCAQGNYTGMNQIKFRPQQVGTYVFKFWNGGNNWINKTIVVQ